MLWDVNKSIRFNWDRENEMEQMKWMIRKDMYNKYFLDTYLFTLQSFRIKFFISMQNQVPSFKCHSFQDLVSCNGTQ